MKVYLTTMLLATVIGAYAQAPQVKGTVTSGGQPLSHVTIRLNGTAGAITDTKGQYTLTLPGAGKHNLHFNIIGYQPHQTSATANTGDKITLNVDLIPAESKLTEVIVTGVSRATELGKNPIPIAVMTKKQMDQGGGNNIIDAVIKGIPGITAVTTGPNISKPFIRGLGYNRVLTMFDGIRQEGQQWGDEHGIEIDQFGISRAEVVKGPASLVYGSDALAGVVNLIPYMPETTSGRLAGEIASNAQSNNGLLSLSAAVYYQQNNWKYAFRATRKIAHDYKNPVDGYVYNTGFKEYNLSAFAQTNRKWGSTKVAATLYNNLQEIPDGSRDSLSRRFTRQLLDAGDDVKNRPVVPANVLTSYQLSPLHQHIQHYRLYNQTLLKLGDGALSSIVALQKSIRREYNHPTQPAQAGLYVVLNTLNYDLKYNLPSINGFESTIGVNGMYQGNRSKQATDFPIPDYNLFDIGSFLFIKKSFGRLDLSGGLRYDLRKINWDNHYIGPNTANGFEKRVYLPDTAASRLQFPAFTKNYTGVSGSLGLTYNITDKLLLKANVARGYRAPNITEIGSNGLDPGAHIVYLGNRTFKPEFSLQQDVGLIAYLKDADISLELFNNNISNYIYQARLNDGNGNPVVIVAGNTTYQYQQSKARLYGAEASFNLHPQTLKWLSFNNSVAAITGLNKNKQLIEKDGDDARYLPLIPPLHARSQLKVSQQKQKGLFAKSYFSLEADGYAAQDKFYAIDNTETATPGYLLINLGAGTVITSHSGRKVMELFLNADNLFNVQYQSNLNRLKYFEYYASSPGGRLGIYNIGRNFSLRVAVPF